MMLGRIKRRLRALTRKGDMDRELDEELHHHIERQIELNVAAGMDPEEARYAALRSFGAVGQAAEECRDARGVRWIEELFQDVRHGWRMLVKNPGFTLIALTTIALGIGANTSIFSVVNAVLLRPLPYPESDRLVFLTERDRQTESLSVSWPDYVDWRMQQSVFEHIGVYSRDSYNLTGDGEPERILTGQVSTDLFAALRVGAALGRIFTNDEDQPGGLPVVVLSHGLWQRRFGGSSNILNQSIRLNERSYTVVGVMPADFQFPARIEMWVPAGQLSGTDWQHRGNHPGLYAIGRLKAGMSLDRARAEMEAIALRLEKQYPDSNRDVHINITPLLETLVGDVSTALWVLFAAAGFMLLIACLDVALLLLARAAARQREMAIRAAMGAGRIRLVRQLLTESMMLALVGGGAGWLLAKWVFGALVSVGTAGLPRASEISLDTRVLVFTAAMAGLTGILFGLAPAWQAGSTSLRQSLKETEHSLTAGKQRTRCVLVITQTALALVLLVGAGLLLRSYYQLSQINAGFAYDHLLSFSLSLPAGKYTGPEQRAEFFSSLTRKIGSLPGVQSVGLASGLPFGNSSWRVPFVVEGGTSLSSAEPQLLEGCVVSPDYFRTMGIPLHAGRYFTEQDNRQHLAGRELSSLDEGAKAVAGLNVIIIDEDFARRYWPGEDAVGKRIRLAPIAPDSPLLTVVGVLGRVKMDRLSVESNRVQGYFSALQLPFSNMTVLIKSQLEPTHIASAVRQQVQSVDSHQPIYNIRTIEEIRSNSIASERLNVTLLGLFASLALMMSAVGIFGVVSYSVTQRTHEIGLRMALGAQTSHVLKLVVGQGMKLAFIGLAIGLPISLVLTPLLRSLVFGISTTDPLTYALVAGLLALVVLLACYLPARRATKVSPMMALRNE